MRINPNSKNAIKQFKHIKHLFISENEDDGFLDLFLLPINARNFDYNSVSDNLMESVADYALSWKIRDKYKDKAMTLSRKAREKFKEAAKNDGELGELLLFCFLEGHLDAPKILTKLELKTSNQLYVNGSDGVHLKKLSDKKYQLIFGESKTYDDLNRAFDNAFKSIGAFVNEINAKGNDKSGINFEKGLISSNIESDIFEKDEDYNDISQLIKTNLATTEVTQTATTRNDSNTTTEQAQHTQVVEVPTPQRSRGTTTYTPPRVQNSPTAPSRNSDSSATVTPPAPVTPTTPAVSETTGTSE